MHAASASAPAPVRGAQAPGAPPGGAPRYRLRGALQWRAFEGEWLVCSAPLGSLFQLDDLSAAVLGLLEAGPADRDSLLASLAEAIGEAPSADPVSGAEVEVDAGALARALDATLARLVADDLVAAPVRS